MSAGEKWTKMRVNRGKLKNQILIYLIYLYISRYLKQGETGMGDKGKKDKGKREKQKKARFTPKEKRKLKKEKKK